MTPQGSYFVSVVIKVHVSFESLLGCNLYKCYGKLLYHQILQILDIFKFLLLEWGHYLFHKVLCILLFKSLQQSFLQHFRLRECNVFQFLPEDDNRHKTV